MNLSSPLYSHEERGARGDDIVVSSNSCRKDFEGDCMIYILHEVLYIYHHIYSQACGRERERDTHRERKRERERETDRLTD